MKKFVLAPQGDFLKNIVISDQESDNPVTVLTQLIAEKKAKAGDVLYLCEPVAEAEAITVSKKIKKL